MGVHGRPAILRQMDTNKYVYFLNDLGLRSFSLDFVDETSSIMV